MAGTITEERIASYDLHTVILTCVADVADGSFPDYDIVGLREWFLYSIETVPGATNPTNNYDVYVRTSRGTDMMGGNGENRAEATGELAHPDTAPEMVDGTITQSIENNGVNSANITIVYQFIR